MGRVVLARLLILVVWITPNAIAAPFLLWFDAKTAYYRFRVRRAKAKSGKAENGGVGEG
jgi:hypothetical protein